MAKLWLLLFSVSIISQCTHAVKMVFTCPAGYRAFTFNTEKYKDEHSPVGKQAYQQCKLKCDKDDWTGEAAINHCTGGFLPKYFTPACDIHDMCYVIPGVDKNGCDNWFLANMKVLCKHQTKDSKEDCEKKANLGYSGVKNFGQSFFDEAQEDGQEFGCKLQWILPTIDGLIVLLGVEIVMVIGIVSVGCMMCMLVLVFVILTKRQKAEDHQIF